MEYIKKTYVWDSSDLGRLGVLGFVMLTQHMLHWIWSGKDCFGNTTVCRDKGIAWGSHNQGEPEENHQYLLALSCKSITTTQIEGWVS